MTGGDKDSDVGMLTNAISKVDNFGRGRTIQRFQLDWVAILKLKLIVH